VAIKTAGTWHHQAVELTKEIGRQTTTITGDSDVHFMNIN